MEDNQIVWQVVCDDRYKCTVLRESEFNGKLLVVDNTNERTLLNKPVTLSYGARFGPDIDDTLMWEQWSLEAIDKEQGDEVPTQDVAPSGR